MASNTARLHQQKQGRPITKEQMLCLQMNTDIDIPLSSKIIWCCVRKEEGWRVPRRMRQLFIVLVCLKDHALFKL